MTEKLPLVDVVRELTETTPHVELYDHTDLGTSIYPTRTLSLIGQLRVAMVHSATSDVGGRPGYMSKPSARMDAVDALLRIDQGAVKWLNRLGVDTLEPATTRGSCGVITWAGMGAVFRCGRTLLAGRRTCIRHGNQRRTPRVTVDSPTEDLVRKLAATAGDNHEVARDIRSWWTHARLVTGWDTPAMRPNGTCPDCRKRGGLRVRMERDASDRFVKFAMCVECKAQWTGDDESFDQLAWHIRVENHEAEGVNA